MVHFSPSLGSFKTTESAMTTFKCGIAAGLFLAPLLALTLAEGGQAEGVMSTVAGTGEAGFTGDGSPASKATLNQPFHCELDGKGNLYIAEAFNHCIRKVDLKTGVISTVAGIGKK